MRFGFSRLSGQRPTGPGFSVTTAGAAAGAGFAAALMVVAVGKNVSAAVPLDAAETGFPPGLILPLLMILVVPLPLMIVSIGFGRLAGLAAVLIGMIAVALYAFMPAGVASLDWARARQAGEIALAFVVIFGVPSVLLATLAARRTEPPSDPQAAPPLTRAEERILGTVVAAAIAYVAVVFSVFLVLAIRDNGGLVAIFDTLVKQYKQHPNAIDQLPKGVDIARLVRLEIWLLVLGMAGFAVAALACNLWLAARIAQTSSLLSVPWPDIPRNLRLPRPLALVLAVALGLAFSGGLVGLVSAVVIGALLAGFAFQGLAVIHAVTRGNRLRGTLLTLVYFFLVITPVPLVYAMIGLLDAFFAFRDRQKPIVVRKKPQDHL